VLDWIMGPLTGRSAVMIVFLSFYLSAGYLQTFQLDLDKTLAAAAGRPYTFCLSRRRESLTFELTPKPMGVA